MKKLIFKSIFLFVFFLPGFSQNIITNTEANNTEKIKQISSTNVNILLFQDMNQGISNFASTQQIGTQNKANINQQNKTYTEMSNQSYTVQSGNSNELTIGQVGSGNTLLGFQLGYVTSNTSTNNGNQFGYGLNIGNGNAFAVGHDKTTGTVLAEGVGNKLTINQNGNNNGVMAVQQGDENNISADQIGNNNYLVVLQKGSNNTVEGYKQENQSNDVLFDKIIQEGDKLSLTTNAKSNPTQFGNSYFQSGNNLAIEINNSLPNSSGVEVEQKGHDMKIVIDQSYFSFPMK